jgi:hypothetical protein
MSPRAYFWWLTGGCAAVLVPVVVLNLILLANDYRYDKNRLASQWQQETRGVTYAPPITSNRAFKTLRLHDRLAEINTLAFGSSTAMSITADQFPAGVRAYNFAQTGNALHSVIGEAGYVVEHWHGRIRLLLIPLDWSLGFVYQPGAIPPVDLAAEHVPPPVAPPVAAQLREALSLPRIQDLGNILHDILRSNDPSSAARQFFLEPAGAPYRCPEGMLARDYETIFRGQCVGFRFDGSATFADQKRVTAATAPGMLAQAASASSQYARALARTAGEPDTMLLAHLVGLLERARAHNVRVLLFLPPLIPGLDARLAASPHSGAQLARTKAALRQWAGRQQVPLFDAGPSAQYGCAATEFIDPHHALPACYGKVLAALFAAQPAVP